MITHDNFLLKLKKISADNNNILCLNLALGFSLNSLSINNRLISSEQLELIIKNTMGEDTFWDMGIPKGQAEFLVFGAAYSTKPVHALSVNVSVGEISKTLMVFGHREWTNYGASIARQFNLMPIKYNYAFGGNGFELNPDGVGYKATIGTLLPNIESSEELLVSIEDIVTPAGFEPFPPNWQQRSQHFIQHPNIDFKMDSVTIPDDILPEHFNTAPNDQRLSGFFNGDEPIQITNMHPLYPSINSKLPGKRLRVFAIQAEEDKEVLNELNIQSDTLWVIPNLECGILQYRITIKINSDDLQDIKFLLIQQEEINGEIRPLEYYANNIIKRYKEAPSNADLYSKIQFTMAAEDLSPKEPNNRNNICSQYKIQLPPPELKYVPQNNASLNEDPELSTMFIEVQKEVSKIMEKLNLNHESLESFKKHREQSGLNSYPSGEEVINYLRESGIKSPELEVLINKANQLLMEIEEDITAENAPLNNHKEHENNKTK
ncbi:DUF2169 domain-containing protein [Aquella oligotrophica]|uniref:DUF2169 domain-containing protein n=1 Tax=Aquella oligotrophica TaxID=2067065 RepID=A0A2I7N9C0_9NEIS|nr:DUF2169 domain-containing protein [Aquella oligotrophica]AUR53057.1 hypothetical protein CUN60_12400 [Aquella oligotrophica]